MSVNLLDSADIASPYIFIKQITHIQ